MAPLDTATNIMSFRLNLPDGRAHREEDVTQARLAAMRNSTLAATTPREGTPLPGDMRLDGSLSVDTSSPALSPGPGRRHVVFPDPVAFRCALSFHISLSPPQALPSFRPTTPLTVHELDQARN